MNEKISLFLYMYKTEKYYWIANIFQNADLDHLNFFHDDMVTHNKREFIRFKIKMLYHLSIRCDSTLGIKDYLVFKPNFSLQKFKEDIKFLSKYTKY